MLDEQLDVIFQKISCLVFQKISGTHDGYTHTYFVMTGMIGSYDGNGCRLNLHVEHSTASSTPVVSRDWTGWTAARGAKLGCGLSLG